MSCSSPTNFDDFESLFADNDEGLESLYQSPTGNSVSSTNSSGTDHSSNQQQPQQPITYDVLSDGYAFGLNEFDLSPQLAAQKQKTGDLAAANPFFAQTTGGNPLSGFVYPNTNTPINPSTKNAFGTTTGFNPQFPMNQLGMYFPQAFPFPQFGGQPFPTCFPNTLAFSSPNTSPIQTSPVNNTTTTSPSNTTTTTESGKAKTTRRKTSNTKKNAKSSTSNNTQTSESTTVEPTTTTSPNSSSTTKATSPSDSVPTISATTPESADSCASSHSSDNDSASSSGKKSGAEEKKRKRKSKNANAGKVLTVEEEKELKRQRRLIKNRESAQASRERKKVYIQGLEKKVDGLAQENTDLQCHVSGLEQENEILRQRLKMLGEVVEEPTTKKRKMTPFTMKVPIPSNPFMLDFWSLFGMGAMQQPQQATQINPAMDVNNIRMDPRAATSSRRVVMFIMLFCVAMFLVFPRSSDIKFDSNMKTELPVDEATANRMRVASRTILSSEPAEKDSTMVDVSIDATQSIVVDEEFKKNVAEIYSSFVEVRQAAESTDAVKSEEQEDKDNNATTAQDAASQINVVFDSDKISLTFPKTVLVKPEEADDAAMVDEQSSNTTDGKISILSTKLLREICRVVGH